MQPRSRSLTPSGAASGSGALPAAAAGTGPTAAGPTRPGSGAAGPAGTGSGAAGPGAAEEPVAATRSGERADPADDIVVISADPADDTVVIDVPPLPQAPPAREPETAGPAAPPSWPRVVATTLSLWAQRRLRRRARPPRAAQPARARWYWIVVLALVVAVFGAGAITVALTRNAAPAGQDQAALGAAAAARRQAASWVARQVDPDAIVACDPAMCSALQAERIPASRLLVLGSGNADPLGSDVVMATAAIRSQFGNRLAGVYAPEVLVSFGQGSAQIVIRAVAPDGAAAYRAALQADQQARAMAGQQLLRNPRLHLAASARRQLAAGAVDARLLTTLATLAALYPIDVASFGGSGAHASAGVPLRSADIAGAAGAAGAHGAASLGSLKAFLLAQRAPYLPAEINAVRLATGQAVLRVEFTAPSPLGLLGSAG